MPRRPRGGEPLRIPEIDMIELYTAGTPNGWKVSIALEELGMPYTVHPVDIMNGEQKQPAFLAINPNGRIPAVIDTDEDNLSIFESGAILIHLAEKAGRLIGHDPASRSRVLQWLMFQMGGVGPMLGQTHHFRVYAPEKIDYAIDRYTNEAKRLYGVMNRQLAKSKYIAGPDYSIADIAIFPWLRSWKNQGIAWNDYPHLKGWFDEIAARPAVQRGVEVLAQQRKPLVDEQSRKMLFGSEQYKPR